MPHPDHYWLADILMAARKIRGIAAGLSREEFQSDDLTELSIERLEGRETQRCKEE
jgi:uncharacterized protein with HEPN domain